MSLKTIREKANLFLYDSKEKVSRIFKGLNLLISLIAISTLIYYYGYPQTEQSEALLLNIIKGSFGFYIINFLVKFIYDFEPRQFFKRNWFEGVLMLFLIVEGISYNFFGVLLLPSLFVKIGLESFADFSTLFIQFYLLTVVLFKIAKTSTILPNLKLHPSNIFILSFLLIILAGTGLLMLPEMTNPLDQSMNFLDALFTSTSATCVTGLIVEDTATFFTFKGQIVILILIKLGGLNIIAFGSFIALMSKFGVGVKQHTVIEDFVNKDSVLSSKGMLGKVIIFSILIELIGTLWMYFSWGDVSFKSNGERMFFSVFHSVSAFNNAGLSLFTDGLYNEAVRTNYMIHNIITFLVFFGALGMMAIFDVFSIRNIRSRLKNKWRQISFGSKIALYFSLGLVAFGTIAYYLLEYDNTLKGQGFTGAFTTSLFQSVTRTSGFNTVDIGAMSTPMLVLMIFLMFIGSSSSSTGGGIKTSTFALLWASIIATVKGKRNTELFKRTISNDLVFRAFSVLLFFILGNMVGIFILTISESHILEQPNRSILDLIFEEVSAFGTVGLSTGITGELSTVGKVVIIISMFVGRIGTLTIAYLFGKQLVSKNYKYPQGHTMVG